MKQCKRCGNKSNDPATYCEKCGAVFSDFPQKGSAETIHNDNTDSRLNLLCLFGFLSVFAMRLVTGFVSGVLAVILSVIGLHQIKTSGERGKGFAIAGLVIGICELVLAVFMLILWGCCGGYYG